MSGTFIKGHPFLSGLVEKTHDLGLLGPMAADAAGAGCGK
jgi:hypothetical protein